MARLVMQQCVSAKLQTNHGSSNEAAHFVTIERGVVAYICFLKGATEQTVDKLIKLISTVKLSRNGDGKLVSFVDLPGDILIVPQATLGGKLRGKTMQYHNNVDKSKGLELYENLIKQCKSLPTNNGKALNVQHGTYGNLQVLQIDTMGPYTHTFEVHDS